MLPSPFPPTVYPFPSLFVSPSFSPHFIASHYGRPYSRRPLYPCTPPLPSLSLHSPPSPSFSISSLPFPLNPLPPSLSLPFPSPPSLPQDPLPSPYNPSLTPHPYHHSSLVSPVAKDVRRPHRRDCRACRGRASRSCLEVVRGEIGDRQGGKYVILDIKVTGAGVWGSLNGRRDYLREVIENDSVGYLMRSCRPKGDVSCGGHKA